MLIICPSCAASYEVPEDAIGPNGRKVRCRACGTSWQAMRSDAPKPAPRPAPVPPAPITPIAPPAEVDPAPAAVVSPASDAFAPGPPFGARRRRIFQGPVLLGLLVFAVVVLGVGVALIAWGPRQVAGALGLSEKPVPLGIAITHEPDWRMIAGGSELFAVSGRIWNPTGQTEPVPDIHAELKDQRGKTVYSWTITRPVARLAPGQSADFDGAAVDVPRASQRIVVSFVKGGR